MKVLIECGDPICDEINKKGDDFIEGLIKLVRKYPKASGDDYAKMMGIGRSTLFYKLKQVGIMLDDIKKALILELEEKQKREITKSEIKELPPIDFNDFINRDSVKEVISKLNIANLSEKQKRTVLRFWFRLCKDLGLSPSDFKNELKIEQIRKSIIEWLNNRVSNGYDKNSLIATIQSLEKWLEIKMLPSGIEQSEYKGKFKEAEIPLQIRDKIVLSLLQKYEKEKNELYLLTIKAFAMLYYTGSRSEALKTFTISHKVTLKNKLLSDKYGVNEFLIIKTQEKGKKGKKISWTKLIPITYKDLIPKTPLTDWEIKKVRKILRSELMNYINELNNDTKRYVLDAKKTLHLIRHTSAREFLKAFGFNRYLVSKLLGWEKDSNLSIYGDYQLLELLEVSSEEHKIMFVSNDVYEKLLKYT